MHASHVSHVHGDPQEWIRTINETHASCPLCEFSGVSSNMLQHLQKKHIQHGVTVIGKYIKTMADFCHLTRPNTNLKLSKYLI